MLPHTIFPIYVLGQMYPMICKFDDGEDDFIADIQTCFKVTIVYKTGSGRHTISPNDIVVSQVQWNYECC